MDFYKLNRGTVSHCMLFMGLISSPLPAMLGTSQVIQMMITSTESQQS